MWDSGFLPLLIIPSSEHRKYQFFIHSVLFFQHLLGMKIKTMTICIWFHFLSLCDDTEILVSDCLDLAFLCLRFYLFFLKFFFLQPAFQGDKVTIHTKFMHYVHGTHNHFIQKKIIKNGSHSTIHPLKNYFVTGFSILSF